MPTMLVSRSDTVPARANNWNPRNIPLCPSARPADWPPRSALEPPRSAAGLLPPEEERPVGFSDLNTSTPQGPQFSFATPSTPAAQSVSPGSFYNQQHPLPAQGQWQYPQRVQPTIHRSRTPPPHQAVPQQQPPVGAPPTQPPPRPPPQRSQRALESAGERTMLLHYSPPESTVLEVQDHSTVSYTHLTLPTICSV